MEATIHKLVRPTKRSRSQYAIRRASQRELALTKQQAVASGVLGAVALVLTALSLTHLAAGIAIVTRAPLWECWSLGIGIDLGFVALELAKVMGRERTRQQVARLLNTAIVGTLAGSAVLNAFAFGAAATGWMVYPAVTAGLAIPAMIFALTKVGAKYWIER